MVRWKACLTLLNFPIVVGSGCAVIKHGPPQAAQPPHLRPNSFAEGQETISRRCIDEYISDVNLNPNATPEIGPPNCSAGMALVPAGNRGWLGGQKILRGRLRCPSSPPTPVEAFCMDEFEASAEEYTACVIAGACPPANACPTENHWLPNTSEVCAGPGGAEAYCQWRGGRLATFDEWTRAASNGDARKFPWGGDLVGPEGLCACRELEQGPCDTHRNTRDVSAHGIHDLGGNAPEWITGARCIGQGWGVEKWPPSVYHWSEGCLEQRTYPELCGIRCVASPLGHSQLVNPDDARSDSPDIGLAREPSRRAYFD